MVLTFSTWHVYVEYSFSTEVDIVRDAYVQAKACIRQLCYAQLDKQTNFRSNFTSADQGIKPMSLCTLNRNETCFHNSARNQTA